MWDFSRFGNKTALIDEYGTAITYEQLEQEGEKISNVISKRCLVFSLCENSIGSILGYSSFLNHNIVPVLLSSHLEKELLENFQFAFHIFHVFY